MVDSHSAWSRFDEVLPVDGRHMKILVGVGNMPLEQLELAPPKSEPRRAVDDADVAGVGADDSSLATLHCPELDQTHLDRRIPIPN